MHRAPASFLTPPLPLLPPSHKRPRRPGCTSHEPCNGLPSTVLKSLPPNYPNRRRIAAVLVSLPARTLRADVAGMMVKSSSFTSTVWPLLLCCAVLASAQSVTPVNGTSALLARNGSDAIGVQISRADGFATPPAIPLVIPLIESASKLPTGGRAGTLFNANVDTIANITLMNIAWISCDPDFYPGELGAINVLQRAAENQAAGALLYSTKASYCNYTPGAEVSSNFQFLYSMSNVRDSNNINLIMNSMPDALPMRATINLAERFQQDNGSSSGSNNSSSSGQPGGPSPSTAVAMIILYSITGVITALFLIIIITGAIRAHRHPERYGPRAMIGRARQSRAKGLARAMLDSIPIVKFGDNEGDIVKPEDVEMAASGSNEQRNEGENHDDNKHEPATEKAERRASDAGPVERTGSVAESEGGIGADVSPPSKPAHSPDQPLGCSICTEDFERGEDVRVLPCNHKFHPACIDPWLLNVSGTCPLCRIDLRPPTSHDPNDPSHSENNNTDDAANASTDAANNVESSTNVPATEGPRRPSRRLSNFLFDPLNRRRMLDATPEERIQALRMYNARNQDAGAVPESRRRRISARLSDAFGRGMKRTDESSAEPSRSVTPVPNSVTSAASLPAPVAGPSRTEVPAETSPDVSPITPSHEAAHDEDESTSAATASIPEIKVDAPQAEDDADDAGPSTRD